LAQPIGRPSWADENFAHMALLSALLYPAPAPSYSASSFPGELLWIPRNMDYSTCSPSECLPAVLLRCNHARYLLIYLHSNAEDIGTARHFGMGVRMLLGMHVLLVEYPGYGVAPGSASDCTENTLWQATVNAFRFVSEVLKWPAEDIIVMGRSLGAALAIRLACSYSFHGLILVSPFLSLAEAVGEYVGAIAPMLVGNIYRNCDLISKVHLPTLVIHALNDRLVPCRQGQKLYELCPHEKKLLVCPATMGHNGDLLRDANFLIHPMLRLFSLPDYSLVDLEVPEEAFSKHHCLNYHAIFEARAADDRTLEVGGDNGPDLVDPAHDVGPRCVNEEGRPHLEGDPDDLDDPGDLDFYVVTDKV